MKLVYKNNMISDTIGNMSGATSESAGSAGLVPAPLSTDRDKFLKGDGTWAEASNVASLSDLTDTSILEPENDEVLEYSNNQWSNSDTLKKTKQIIADVETSPATSAHAIGTKIIYNNVLYKVTSAISANDTLSVGTNIALDDSITSQIDTINESLTNQANAMVNVYGSKNILQNNLVSMSQDGVNFVVNEDKSITIDTNGQTVSVEQNGVALCHFVSEFSGDFILSHGNTTLPSELRLMMEDATVHEWSVAPQTVSMVKGHTYWVWIIYNAGLNIAQASAKRIYPMLRDVRIIDGYYEPYSMTNQQMTPYVQAISNPNLLDNPWFTVNQRGQSSYGDNTTTGSIYSIDRWQRNKYDENGHKFTVGAIEIPYLKGDFFQVIEADVHHWRHVPYTLSAIVDGNLYSKTFTPYDDGQNHMGTDAWGPMSLGLDGLYWNIIEYWGGFQKQKYLVGINNYNASQDHVISAMKLELGTVSTLAMDTAPNYATELLKCQRYFIAMPFYTQGTGAYSQFETSIPNPVFMRATPTISNVECKYLGSGSWIDVDSDKYALTVYNEYTTRFAVFNLSPNQLVRAKYHLSADL